MITKFIKSYTECNLKLKEKLLREYQNKWITLFNEVIANPLDHELQWRYNQCFALPITISKSHTLEIQFDINKLLEVMNTLNLPTIEFPTNNFIKNNVTNREIFINNPKLISYSIDKSFSKVSNQPIIVLKPTFYFNFVLDGNHRVDYSIKNNRTTIKGYLLSSKFLVTTPHLFADRLSFLLFCFLEDVSTLDLYFDEKQSKGIFGILKTQSSLLKKYSILPIALQYIDETSHSY